MNTQTKTKNKWRGNDVMVSQFNSAHVVWLEPIVLERNSYSPSSLNEAGVLVLTKTQYDELLVDFYKNDKTPRKRKTW